MAYPQVIIPPSVKPVSPLELTPQDDLTVPFQPRFARGTTQRQTWGDPIWSAQVRFEGMSGADRALVKAAIMGARGGAANILMTPGIPLRGSFQATELLTNNDFSNGTTGWTAQASTLSAIDGGIRVKPSSGGGGTQPGFSQTITSVQYSPYVGRGFARQVSSRGSTLASYATDGTTSAWRAASGLSTLAYVPLSTSLQFFPAYITDGVWDVADAVDTYYSSLSRCILADAGANALTYSDQIDNAAWIKGACTVTANSHTAPDGTVTVEKIIEDTSTGSHYVYRVDGSRASAAADLCAYGVFGPSVLDRDVRFLVSGDASFAHYAEVTLDVSAGTLSGLGVTGSATNARAFVKSMGSGYYAVWIVARMPTGTAVATQINLVNGGSTSYTGTTGAIAVWRWGACVSSVPVRLTQTVSAAVASGTSQTGSTIYVKGLPVSTSGLLLAGDYFEINGELKQCTASLDSDAAGLGVLRFAPGLAVAAADNDPIIVNNPFGRFRLAADPQITERFGVYTDVDLQLIEATA